MYCESQLLNLPFPPMRNPFLLLFLLLLLASCRLIYKPDTAYIISVRNYLDYDLRVKWLTNRDSGEVVLLANPLDSARVYLHSSHLDRAGDAGALSDKLFSEIIRQVWVQRLEPGTAVPFDSLPIAVQAPAYWRSRYSEDDFIGSITHYYEYELKTDSL